LFLNHELEEGELRWQIRQFAEKGAGGLALHARFGLETPYFSPEWWKAIDTIIEETGKLGLLVYLYDENVWPSGVANGQVIRENPEYLLTGLQPAETWRVSGPAAVERAVSPGPIAKAYAVPLEKGRVKDPEGIRELKVNDDRVEGELPAGDWEVRAFRQIWWRQGFLGGYADPLNPAPTRRFLELSHAEYTKRYGHLFGKRIPAIFTDEPAFNSPSATSYDERGGTLTWSPVLEGEFLRRKGYPVGRALIAQCRDVGPTSAKLRCDFWEVVTDLYGENFFGIIREYLDAQGLGYIGHLLYEGELIGLTRSQGDFFKTIRHLTYGGCDFLTDQTWPVSGTPWGPVNNVAAPKMASSASHLFGKSRTLSEAFGLGSGWGISLRTLRHLTDWQVALGINLFQQHAFYYTIQGFRKWDCPPSESYQNPFWPHYRRYADYAARLCEVFRGAEHVCEIALLVPTRTLWATLEPYDEEVVSRTVRGFEHAGETLLRLQLDHDYISEELLLEARLEDGAFLLPAEAEQPHRLRVLVLPPCQTLSRRTLERLEVFARQGGRVVLCEPTATLSSERGEDPDLAQRLGALPVRRVPGLADQTLPARLEALAGAFGDYQRDVILRTAAGKSAEHVVAAHYRKEGTDFYLLVNTDRENGLELEASFGASGLPAVWEPESGETRPISSEEVRREEGRSQLRLYLPAAGSQLIAFSGRAAEGKTARLRAGIDGAEVLRLPDGWDFRALRANALPLRSWRYEMIPQHRHPLQTVAARSYETSFDLELDLPQARLLLDGLLTDKAWNRTTPIAVNVILNGQRIDRFEQGAYLDHLIREAEVGPLLRRGRNELRIETSGFLHEPGALQHPAFLIGDFALERRGETWVAVAPKGGKRSGSWTEFGYPFYSGVGAYSQTFALPEGAGAGGKIVLRLSGAADLAEVVLNGRRLGAATWEPWEVELTPGLRAGENQLEIRIANSLANLLEERSRPSGLLGEAVLVRVES
jgi:hypothetical protein